MSSPDLELQGVTVQFGGHTAVSSLDLRAPGGEITGLIGPNGAGKSTTFNAASGVLTPAAGTVRLGQDSLDGMSPSGRAQRGLGRTFQRMELFETMTVAENVGLGAEALLSGRRPWGQLFATPTQSADVRSRAGAALTRCGIGDLGARPASDLSTGQQRLVELARAIAAGFSFLLLDEPSSGLDESESASFAQILIDLADRDGVGILIVEHDMALVRQTCSYVYVLDFGELIIQGPTDEVLASDIVRAAYLGQEAA